MKVGFIGLGMMGGSFAGNLVKHGFETMVHDVSRQRAQAHLDQGAGWADTPAEMARACDVVLASLPGPADVESVATAPETGLLSGFTPGKVFFDLSTNAPAMVRRLHEAYLADGVHFLDAPVSGGPAGAASGKLAIWVGGDRAVFDAHRQVLDALGDQVRYIGDIGAGSVAKLVHNAAGYAIQTALAEVFSVGVKAGVDPLSLWEAVRQGARGRVRTFDSLADHFLQNNYDPSKFSLRLAHKDVALANELAREVGVPGRMMALTEAELGEALNRGWGERDSRVAMLLQLERAALEIQVEAERLRAVLDADDRKA